MIERNIIFGAPDGEGIKVGAGRESGPDPVDVIIRFNTIYDTAKPILLAHETAGTYIARNLMVRATGRVNDGTPTVTALIHGYHLDGAGDRFRNNYGYGATRFLWEQPPYTQRISAEPGNAFNEAAPRFDSIGCGGFHPAEPLAQGYGRWAP